MLVRLAFSGKGDTISWKFAEPGLYFSRFFILSLVKTIHFKLLSIWLPNNSILIFLLLPALALFIYLLTVLFTVFFLSFSSVSSRKEG